MVNRIRGYILDLFKKRDKKKIVFALGIIGIVLILISSIIPSSTTDNKRETSQTDYDEYIENLEIRTVNIISQIDGVGKCKVMITLQQTDEYVYAKNVQENESNGSYSHKNEYVLYEDNNDDTPILIKQYFPKVSGVVVVCQGGDNDTVKEKVQSTVSSLFGISSTKISISKLR